MLYKRRMLSVVLCIALLFSMIPFSVFASDQNTDVEGYVECDGSHVFEFQTGAGKVKKDVSTCYYYDKYFTDEEEGNSKVYNPSLSTMSLCLAMSGFARSEGEWTTQLDHPDPRFKYARDLLIGKIDDQDDVGLGFVDFAVNDVWGASPGRDTIGVVAARKVLSDGSDLVAVVVRGAGYEGEWCSNFTIGKENDHTGFAQGRNDVLDFMKAYFSSKNLDPNSTKIWIVGYSRGAAVANMVAAKIDDGYKFSDNASIKQENLYAYTFSTPLGGIEENTNDEKYENIHNVVNYNDMVALIAPTEWDFDRYNSNNDVFLPNKVKNKDFDQLREKMLSKYSSLEMSKVLPYNVQEEREIRKIKSIDWDDEGNPIIEYDEPEVITHRQAASDIFDFVAHRVFGDRSSYFYIHQNNLREIIWEIFGSKNAAAKKAMAQLLEGLTVEQIVSMGKPLLDKKHISKKDYRDFYVNVESYVNSIISESNAWSNEEDDDYITPIVNILFNLVKGVLIDYIFYDGYYLATIVSFAEGLADKSVIAAHYPEINLSWMMSMDTNYDTPSGDEGNQEKETPSQDIVNSDKNPDTGDYDNIFAFIVLLCVAGVAMMVAVKNCRRDD